MYSDQLNSPLARFVAMRTDCMKKIRDLIPLGPENFSFHHVDRVMDWYAFWDHISDNRPHHCKLKTHIFEITFDEVKLKWEVTECELDQGIHQRANLVVDQLNKYEKDITLLRQWIKHQAIKK